MTRNRLPAQPEKLARRWRHVAFAILALALAAAAGVIGSVRSAAAQTAATAEEKAAARAAYDRALREFKALAKYL